MFEGIEKQKNKYMKVLPCAKQSNKPSDCVETRTLNHLVRKETFTQFGLMVECSFTRYVVARLSPVEVS